MGTGASEAGRARKRKNSAKTGRGFWNNRARGASERASKKGIQQRPEPQQREEIVRAFFGIGVCYAHLAEATRNGALPPRQLATEARSNRTQIEQQ